MRAYPAEILIKIRSDTSKYQEGIKFQPPNNHDNLPKVLDSETWFCQKQGTKEYSKYTIFPQISTNGACLVQKFEAYDAAIIEGQCLKEGGTSSKVRNILVKFQNFVIVFLQITAN